MQFTLNRNQLLLTGMGIICFYLVLNRAEFMWGSETAVGKVLAYDIRTPASYSHSVITYTTKSGAVITFCGPSNYEIPAGETVKVLYLVDKPDTAYVFTFKGFWLLPIIYTFFPLMVFVSFILSYLKERDNITFNISRAFSIRRTRSAKPVQHNNSKRLAKH
jgi:hypothetical protein